MRKKLPGITERIISFLAWTSGLLTFTILGLIVIFLSLFINPKHFDGFVKLSCRLIIRALFIRVNLHGVDYVRKNSTFLFMSNHVNIFDVFVVFGRIPVYVRGVELEDHFTWPFYGRIIRRLGMIPISHTNPRAAIKSLKIAQETIADGTSVIIFPEGGRTLDGQFKPFKRGSFLLAKQAGVDIVPMVMVNAFRIKRKGNQLIRPGKMTVRFGEPVLYEDIKNLKTSDISSLVQQKMTALIEQ
jgi:1-acyl-sn-glycerol-3-phosphate acyltransferase